MTLEDALKEGSKNRSSFYPNPNFKQQLKKFEKALIGKDPECIELLENATQDRISNQGSS